jgi:two-component system OmpR family response regulator
MLLTLRNIGKRTPVLILSALGAVDERVRGLRAGGDDCVTNPFDSLEFMARQKVLLHRHSPAAHSLFSVGDLTFNTSTHRMERAGQALDLKPREYSLLEFMIRHSGQVVTRTRLLESVWN